MTDISTLESILADPFAPLSRATDQPRFVLLVARRHSSGRFAYHLWRLPRLRTFNLDDARISAAAWGLPVKEIGPADAFGRKPKQCCPSDAVLEQYLELAARQEAGPMVDFAVEHPTEAAILFAVTPFLHWHEERGE